MSSYNYKRFLLLIFLQLHRVGSFRRRADNGESEDAGSETSSLCSESSYRSYGNTSEV